jgi:hypothetical protein
MLLVRATGEEPNNEDRAELRRDMFCKVRAEAGSEVESMVTCWVAADGSSVCGVFWDIIKKAF